MKLNLSGITFILTSAILSASALYADMLHPVCMDRLLSGPENPAHRKQMPPEEHDLTECQNSTKPLKFEKLSQYHARFKLPEDNRDNSLPYFVEYKVIGLMTGQQALVQITSNYGGTMTLSGGLIISDDNSGERRKVTVHQEIVGGDRCFGGIEKLSIIAPDKVEIQRRITTDTLLNLDNQQNTPVEGVAGCAICCIGLSTEQLQTGQPAELHKVHLNRTIPSTKVARHQGCFNELTGSLSEQRPLEMNRQQLENFQKSFKRQCLSVPEG